ncbi:MAG: response regulator transcription factor [Candidatus Zipacnadales bacterium]
MPEKVLIIEDDANIREMLSEGLREAGMEIMAAAKGVDGLVQESEGHPDIIVLDLMLPDISGFEVCRRIRTRSHVPIIVVTARTDESDAVEALGAGADDFVRKPFQIREVVARVRALTRRAKEYTEAARAEEVLEFKDLIIDSVKHEVIVGGKPVKFTPKEFELLLMLARVPGKMMHRQELLEAIWGYDSTIESRTLDVHIGRVRAKIEADPKEPTRIITVPGVGYKFMGDESE